MAQNERIKGNWKNKSARKDTIILTPGEMTFSDLDYYNKKQERNEPYVDTTFYWNFLGRDTLRIEFSIRSFSGAKEQVGSQIFIALPSNIEFYQKKPKQGGIYLKKIDPDLDTVIKLLENKELYSETVKKINPPDSSQTSNINISKTDSINKSYEALNLNISGGISISLWDVKIGNWKVLEENLLSITSTTLFDGIYHMSFNQKGALILIKQK